MVITFLIAIFIGTQLPAPPPLSYTGPSGSFAMETYEYDILRLWGELQRTRTAAMARFPASPTPHSPIGFLCPMFPLYTFIADRATA